MHRFVVLNDGETFTGLDGCKIVQHPTEECPDDELIKELYEAESAIPIQRPEDKEVELRVAIIDLADLLRGRLSADTAEVEEALEKTDNVYTKMIPAGLSEEMVKLIALGLLFDNGWEMFNTHSEWSIIVKQ